MRPWLRAVPAAIRARVEDRPRLQRVLFNTSWLFADRILRMGVGVLLSAWIARYLGTASFGALSYAMAFVALFGSFATLGLDGIVVRDLVRGLDLGATLGTAFALRLTGSLVALACATATILVVRPGDPLEARLVVILAAATLFQSVDVVDFWFQSRVASRYAVIAKNGAFLVVAVVRAALVILRAPLVAFAWAAFLEAAVGAIGLAVVYRYNADRDRLPWRVSAARSRELLVASWPLIVSGMAITIYMRIDVIMLGSMIGDGGAGTYAAATRLSEIWYFVPTAITSSLAPSIVEAKAAGGALYYQRLSRLFAWMTGLAIAVALPMTLLSGPLTRLLYGDAYAAAGPVLAVHVWAGVFVALGVAQGLWDINEGLLNLGLYRTIAGAVTNVALNVVLIPRYGAMGAAIATVVSYGLSACLLNVVSARTRPIFQLQLDALRFRGTNPTGTRK